MKKLSTFIPALFLAVSLLAQSPDAFHYQAVVRDSNGDVISNATVGVQISILQGGENSSAVYVESFAPMTNDFGLFSVRIGNGTPVEGDFENINWGDGPYFINTEVDPSGGTSYTDLGAAPLASVPYALHASTANSSVNADTADHAVTSASAEMATNATTALYADTANYADTASYAETAGNVFDGDYYSLSNSPDWNDTIDLRLENAIVVNGPASSGNLVTYDGNNWIARDIYLASTGNSQPVSIVQPYLAVNYCIALVGIFPSRNWDPFIGTIGIFGFNFAPRGWAQCNGQLLPISQYNALFALIGTYYGGDGRTTFALPDLRGRVAINQGQGPGLSPYQMGQKGGVEQVPVTIQNLPAHTHNIVFE